MRRFVLCLLAVAGSAAAEDWRSMSGAEISEALTGKTLAYEVAWQEFRVSGQTLYNAGRDNWGYWRVEGDRYCSQWPPQGGWDCYNLESDGHDVRFVESNGDVTIGRFVD